VQKHIKYTDNDFTMFGAKTLAELCLSETNVFSNVLALTIDECLQCHSAKACMSAALVSILSG
jgi:hypothetical protein